MSHLSLRSRLLIPLLVILLVGLAGAPVLASIVTTRHLDDRDESRLRGLSRVVGGSLSGRTRVELSEDQLERLPGNADVVVVYLDAEEKVVLTVDRRSAAGPGHLDSIVTAALDRPAGRITRLDQDDASYHVIRTATPGLTVATDSDTRQIAQIVIASDRSDDEAVVATLERAGATFAIVAMLVLGALAAWTLHHSLRPLERIAAIADAAGRAVPKWRGEPAPQPATRRIDGPASGPEGDPGFGPASRGAAPEVARLGSALADAFAARARAEETVRSFMLDASHELRTPLTTLSGWLDLYAQGGLSDPTELDRAVGRMESEVGRMRLLVDELDLLARMDQGRPLELVDVSLADLLADVVDDVRVVAPDRRIGLDVAGEPVVRADARRLEQIVRNLLGNALQHTPAGTPVEVCAAVREGRLVVEIVDHGPGIADADLDRIFERFYRSSTGRRHGSGLGLAIVRALVQAHDGTVSADGTTDGGATVTVRLPLARTVSEPSGSA